MNRAKIALPFVAQLLLMIAGNATAQQPKALFYMTRDPDSVRSFLAHADKVGLQGFCSWVLGREDPAIWEHLPSHK